MLDYFVYLGATLREQEETQGEGEGKKQKDGTAEGV